MRLSSDTWWLFFAAAASIAVAPLVMRGDSATETQRQRSQRALEMMTPAQRQRLDDSYERYKSLTPQDRDRWKQFHVEVETDRVQNPAIGRALDVYSDWLPSVSAFDSDRVRNGSSVEERVSLIKQLEQQKSERSSRPWRSPIESEKFYAVMSEIEREADRALSSDQLQQIYSLQANTPGRALQTIQLLKGKEMTFASAVSEPALERMIDILDKDWIRRAETQRNRSDSQWQDDYTGPPNGFKRWLVGQLLAGKLFEELLIESMKNPPTDQELLEKLRSIDEEKRRLYYSLSAAEAKRFVRHQSFAERNGQIAEALTKFFDWRPPWEMRRGPNRGPDGRRGGGRDNEGRRGPRDDRGPDDDNRAGPPRGEGPPDGPGEPRREPRPEGQP